MSSEKPREHFKQQKDGIILIKELFQHTAYELQQSIHIINMIR